MKAKVKSQVNLLCISLKSESRNDSRKVSSDLKIGSFGLCRHNFEYNTISGASSIMLA